MLKLEGTAFTNVFPSLYKKTNNAYFQHLSIDSKGDAIGNYNKTIKRYYD